MNVLYESEQLQFRDSVDRLIRDHCTPELRRRRKAAGEPGTAPLWRGLAELGCLGLGIPESQGGHGGGPVDVGLVAEACGKGLVPEPFAATVVTAGLLAATGSAPLREAWITRVVAGQCRLALAHEDDASAPVLAHRDGGGWRLDGGKQFVEHAPLADALVVSAALGGDPGQPGLFLLQRGTPGLTQSAFVTVDGGTAAHLRLDRVQLPAEAQLDAADAGGTLAAALDSLTVAACSEAVGCMQALLEQTVAYTRTRVQFGRPLADNQVLRHRMVDMSIQLEEARATTLRAALHLQHPAAQRARAVSSAKVKVCRAGRIVAEGAIQLHGAMGVTDELEVGEHARRLLRISASNGTELAHRQRIAQLRAAQAH